LLSSAKPIEFGRISSTSWCAIFISGSGCQFPDALDS
jgi:hypothetical protein